MAARSRASPSRSKLAGTVSGWRAGYGPATSKSTSSIRRAWQYRASIAGRKQIDSTLDCSNASSSAGCVVRFGVRNFKPTLRKAPERLETLQTPEGVPLPPNTLLELRRDMARLRFVMDQIKQVEEARAQRLEQAPQEKSHAMVRLLARVIGVGIETADMLVHEVLARNLRDRRAVARYAGLTGAPDESGSKR